MKYLLNIIKLIIIIMITTLLFGTLSYLNIISDDICSIIQIVVFFVSLFLISYKMGKEKEKNGYIEGIVLGLITLFTFLIINLGFKKEINKIKLIYYLFILIISISGSILGINKKTKV